MTGRTRHHDIDYVEIPVDDVDAAKAFYGAAFGWVFTDYGPEYAGIRGLDGAGAEIGGLAHVEPADHPDVGRRHPLVILFSEDLDATARAVEAAGGVVSTPPYEFPGGRRFHLTDPAGNELAVWSQD